MDSLIYNPKKDEVVIRFVAELKRTIPADLRNVISMGLVQGEILKNFPTMIF